MPKSTEIKTTLDINEIGFFRIRDILGDRKRGISAIIPVCRTVWYEGVADGRFPPPIDKTYGCKAVFWRKKDIFDLVRKMEQGLTA